MSTVARGLHSNHRNLNRLSTSATATADARHTGCDETTVLQRSTRTDETVVSSTQLYSRTAGESMNFLEETFLTSLILVFVSLRQSLVSLLRVSHPPLLRLSAFDVLSAAVIYYSITLTIISTQIYQLSWWLPWTRIKNLSLIHSVASGMFFCYLYSSQPSCCTCNPLLTPRSLALVCALLWHSLSFVNTVKEEFSI